MKPHYIFFLFYVLLCFGKLTGLPPDSELPDPVDLNTDNLNYFDTSGNELEARISHFHDYLIQLLSKSDSLNDDEISYLISKIDLSLRALSSLKNEPEYPPPTFSPLSENYTIDDLIDLHRNFRKKSLDLKNLKDEKQEKQRNADLALNNFDRQIETYRKFSESSIDKTISGLKTIYYFLLLKIGEKELRKINQNISNDEELLKHLKDEISFASQHLTTSSIEVQALREDTKTLKENWLKIQNEHQSKEVEQLIDAYSQENAGRPSIRQESLKANLEELQAKLKFLFAEIKLTLVLLIQNPHQVELSRMGSTLTSWAQLLNHLQQLTNSWLIKSQKTIQRTGQILSLDTEADPKDSEQALKMAQENFLTIQSLNNELDDSQFLIEVIKKHVAALQGNISHLFSSFFSLLGQAYDNFTSWLETTIFHIGLTPITYSGLFRFGLILLATLLISKLLIRALSHYALEKKKVQKSVVYRLSRLLHYLVLTIGTILALSAIGFDFSSLLLVAGALGVGLGFGLQSIFNNFISGIIMLFESQLKIGDFIELPPNVKGEIREINVRTTILSTGDGTEVIVPNADIISNKVINWTLKHPYKRYSVPFSVEYGSDVELVKKAVAEAAKQVPQTLSKPGFADPVVILTEFGESGLNFALLVWVNEKYSRLGPVTVSEYLTVINDSLTAHNIKQPFPQRDISITQLLGTNNIKELKKHLS